MLIDESMLNVLIGNQRSAIRYHLTFALGTFVAGMVVISVASLIQGVIVQEGFKTLLVIGGGFVSSLAVFPIKEILSRRDKERLLQELKTRVTMIQHDDKLDIEAQSRLENQITNFVERMLG